MMSTVTAADIERAYARIEGRTLRTPVTHSPRLSRLYGTDLSFKWENLQHTGSFKVRGALNRLLQLSEAQRAGGVVAASAGNHAQGVAYFARELDVHARIVMPVGTPLIKVTATQELGAEVSLHGETYDDAYEYACTLSRDQNRTLIHAFEDPHIIAGQGTVALELLEDGDFPFDTVVCPVGGGGLLAGIATLIRSKQPSVRIVGVEAAACPGVRSSLDAGRCVALPRAASLADGIAVKRCGELNLEIIKALVDDVVTVGEDEIARSVLHLLELEKMVVEGAGAVGLAAVAAGAAGSDGQRVLCVVTGGNIDVNLIGKIIRRGLSWDGRIVRLDIRVEDKPGFLYRALEVVKRLGANILDVYHRRFGTSAPFGEVDIELELETRGVEHIEQIKAALEREGFRPIDPV